MKNSIYKTRLSKGMMTILGSMALISCGAMMEGYTETDGIYYDPNSDKIEQKIAWQEPQREREYYDYDGGIIGQSQKTEKQQNERFNNQNWGNNQQISSSDWGVYTGTQNNYHYDNYSWNYPYYNNFYSPYYFGYYNSYFGNFYSWNMNYTWGNPWWGHSYYNPYHLGYYNYWGMNNYWHYDPFYSPYYHRRYYGYRRPYYNNYYTTPSRTHYRRSGVNNGNYSPSNYETPRYGTGFRTAPQRPTPTAPSHNNNGNARVFRSVPNNTSSQNNSTWGNHNNGNSSSSGNFRSGGTTTNSTRSGSNSGFRSGGFR